MLKKSTWPPLIILLSLGLFFLILQLTCKSILEIDGFFYIKKALLISQQGALTNFPWLSFTIYSQNGFGPHFIFPYLLIPLIKIFGLIGGPKLLISLLNGAIFSLFYVLLTKLKITKPLIWTLLFFLGSFYFLWRINFIRPINISVIIFLLLCYSLINHKYVILSLAAFFYSWFYDGFLLFLFPLLIFLTVKTVLEKKIPLKFILIYFFSSLLGLIINPFFPKNISYFFTSYLNIVNNLFNKQLISSVELLPPLLTDLFQQNIIMVLVIIFSAMILFLIKLNGRTNNFTNREKITGYFLGLNALTFTILTLKLVHFIDYLAPSAFLAAGYFFTLFSRSPKTAELQLFINQLRHQLNRPFLKTLTIIGLLGLAWLPLKSLYLEFQQAAGLNRYQLTAEWLKKQTPAQSIIFHSAWDAFPRLFFLNDHNYYLVGLYPTYLYAFDQTRYWLWRNITEKSAACPAPINLTASNCKDDRQTPQAVAVTIKNQFQSEYIWVNDYPLYHGFKKFLETNPEYFQKMIETDDSSVFKIIK